MIKITDTIPVPPIFNRKEYNKQWKRQHKERVKEASAKYYKKNKAIINAAAKQWQKDHKAKFKDYTKKWREKNKDRAHNLSIKQRYNVTQEQVDIMFEIQERRCAICNKEMVKPRIDHCHKTKQFRGILCHNCNIILGLAHDQPEVLRNAAFYLESKI